MRGLGACGTAAPDAPTGRLRPRKNKVMVGTAYAHHTHTSSTLGLGEKLKTPLRTEPYQLVAEYHEVMSHADDVPNVMTPAS